MRYLRTEAIALAEIEVPARLRPVDPEEAERIRASFAERGQSTPIEVVEQLRGPRYRLVAGAHRVAAAKALGWSTIRAEIKALESDQAEVELLLAEIDENLQRHELNPLDRAMFVGRRLELYRALHPERLGSGGDRKSDAYRSRSGDYPSFSDEVAALLGRSKELVKRSVRIYGLGPELLQRLAGTPLARQEGELYRLCTYAPEQRQAIVTRLLGQEAETVRAAAAAAFPEARGEPPAAHEQQRQKLREAWDRAGLRARRAHLQFLAEIGVIPGFDLSGLEESEA